MRKKQDLRLVPTTDKDLTALATVTPASLARAVLAWEEVAPVALKELPNAVAET